MSTPYDSDALALIVSRDEVERGDTSRVVELLHGLLDEPARIAKFADSLTIGFGGYDSDPRPLYRVEEVRRFVNGMDAQFPFWFYFCGKHDHSLKLIALCLLKPKLFNRTLSIKNPEFYSFFSNRMGSASSLCKLAQLQDAKRELMYHRSMAYFGISRSEVGSIIMKMTKAGMASRS